MANVMIGTAGIKKALSKYVSLKSITEYIWNGFDAQADTIKIKFLTNEFDVIQGVIIEDNGYGIEKEKLEEKFRPFLDSEKTFDPDNRSSDTHGKNGVGRLTFFKFASCASWNTTYKKEDINYNYTINISADKLQDYVPTEATITNKPTGTIVTLSEIIVDLSKEEIKDYILQEFCWYLALNKNKNYFIFFEDEALDYNCLVEDSEPIEIQQDNISYMVSYIQWNCKINEEYSRYYFINTDDKEIGKRTTTLNNKADNFYHSVYIESELFDNFTFTDNQLDGQISMRNIPKTTKSKEYKYIKSEVDKFLRKKRRLFIDKHAFEIVAKMEIEKAFPNFNRDNVIDVYKKSQLEGIVKSIYTVKPNMFYGLSEDQKKTLVRLLDLIMQTNEVNSLITILEEIINMDSEERQDLCEMLNYTKMSNITKTIKLLKDRYKAVEELKLLLFDKELKANEVVHLQQFIEKHYWLFGEQYNLMTAAEPKFEEALRRWLSYLHKEYDEASIEHPDKLKEMDIFTVRRNFDGSVSNVIVELKHPNINIGETQLSQVKKYMDVIFKQAEFNDPNATWDFYLVGNKFTTNGYIEGEIENCRNHGEKSLVYKVRNFKIYVKKWSEVFNEFELKYKWLNEKLELERDKLVLTDKSADDIIKEQENNTAIQPKEYSVEGETN